VGSIDAGASKTVPVTVNVPVTVGRFSISEIGLAESVTGAKSTLIFTQTVVPNVD